LDFALSLSLSLIPALLAQEPGPAPEVAPRRIRLFDRMDIARIEGRIEPSTAEPKERVDRNLGFEPGFETTQRAWLGHRIGRTAKFEDETWKLATITPDSGVTGGALKIGPGIEDDAAFFDFVVAAHPLAHYVLRGRAKVVGNPAAEEASARECIVVRELVGEIDDPTKLGLYNHTVLETHRGSRDLDPGAAKDGWQPFAVEIELTQPQTGSLEIRLLHRSGGGKDAVTWFDDLELSETHLSEAQTWALFLSSCRPNDGKAEATPWRLRVTLPTADFIKDETRDAVLLEPPSVLTIPVALPPADSKPTLRFEYGMLSAVSSIPGDGARITVTFTTRSGAPGGGAPVELGRVDFDPKTDEKQRCWLTARMDLSAVAGREGELRFAASDPGERDLFDAVVLATPRVEPAAEPPRGLNVLVMASDTLRADRLSAFGYGRPTSPNLERLAKHAVRFSNTRSQAPWTLPSFSSIMTSMYPSEHGAGRGGRDEWTPLDPGVETLADVLARVGYETAGITANHLISPEYGLDQGFESYAIPGELEWTKLQMESVELDAPLVVQFLEQHRSTPFFLFWHMMDPHLPYTTNPEFRAAFTDPGYDGRFKHPDGGGEPIVPFQVLDPRPGRRWFTQEGPPKPPPLTDADKKFVSDYYDSEIKEIDAAIGKVIDALERTGLWDRTIVAMIADHGEGLGEHGHYHHGYTLFEDQVHIPFLLRVPGRTEGVTVDSPVASIDLAPTILAALSIPSPESFHGVDRLAKTPSSQPVFLEYPSYDSSAQKGVILGDFKYLHDPWFHTEALYDTKNDPLERTDVRAEHPDLVARGRALLDEFRWDRLQKGRFHVRVHGRAGMKLRIAVATNDLFDANFATRPLLDENDFKLDFDRRQLVLETTMPSDKLELVCWCRGEALKFEVSLDGRPIASGIRLGEETEGRSSPISIERTGVPTLSGDSLAPPKQDQAVIWMERGAGDVKPVVPTAAEAELLRQLGYAH
jgi:arylsulfatase